MYVVQRINLLEIKLLGLINQSQDQYTSTHGKGFILNTIPTTYATWQRKRPRWALSVFIIDDGWFEGRNDDTSSLGDWSLDRSKYPDGLEPVIDHVNQQGMEFGIWIEPEMVNEDSNLYRLHPEWVLTTKGYPTPKGRNQWVLNLQNQECFDYLYGCFDQLLSTYNIGYIKWDMNREIVQPTHDEKSAVHGQTHALYRLLDKLVLAHPKVEFESCSSGGGRIDYEILQRTCRFWASDCNDALERQTIQKNMSVFFPPEVMGAHIGPQDSHTTRRHHNINLRGVTALFGHMGCRA